MYKAGVRPNVVRFRASGTEKKTKAELEVAELKMLRFSLGVQD